MGDGETKASGAEQPAKTANADGAAPAAAPVLERWRSWLTGAPQDQQANAAEQSRINECKGMCICGHGITEKDIYCPNCNLKLPKAEPTLRPNAPGAADTAVTTTASSDSLPSHAPGSSADGIADTSEPRPNATSVACDAADQTLGTTVSSGSHASSHARTPSADGPPVAGLDDSDVHQLVEQALNMMPSPKSPNRSTSDAPGDTLASSPANRCPDAAQVGPLRHICEVVDEKA